MSKFWIWLIRKRKNIKIWKPANVYDSAIIGANVSIARFAEVGHNVVIGDNTRIGMGSFICEGVAIGKNVFIGPRVCFSNDMYPPSNKDAWQPTIVCDGASIGANVSIRPGVMIGSGALIGMGSVVTKDVPANEIWAGVPARKIRDRKV